MTIISNLIKVKLLFLYVLFIILYRVDDYMTEREKGLNGELYNPNYDEEIIRLREKMQDLCFQYNNIFSFLIKNQ